MIDGGDWWIEGYRLLCAAIEEDAQRASEETKRQRQAEKEALLKRERDRRQAREESYVHEIIIEKVTEVEQEAAETDDTSKAEEERRLRQKEKEQRQRANEKKAAELEELYPNTF